MREIVVISGKGGTGKTSLTASFAVLSGRAVVVDADVDASDLHLVLSPKVLERNGFRSGREAFIREADCGRCGLCFDYCRFDAVENTPEGAYVVDPAACEGCGVCVRFCPVKAVDFPERTCGIWMVSETRCGPLVHARLKPGGENSGKLVSTVRHEAKRVAAESGREMIIVDGPPGIGCPVIASVTGASGLLVVAEPTVSGAHDLGRVLELAKHFSIPAAVCVNKWDINPEAASRIEEEARRAGARIAGRVRSDPAVTKAQVQARAVVETGGPAAEDITRVFHRVFEEEWDGNR